MSTDLHLHHQQLPKLRITAVKIDAAAAEDDDNNVPSSPDRDAVSSVVTPTENQNDVAVAQEDESYRTPTSKESKIPAMMTCPPAPRKPKPFVACKRKLLDFFEVTNEDMDTFFRSTFPKRSCPCT